MSELFKSPVMPDFNTLATMGAIPNAKTVIVSGHHPDIDSETRDLWGSDSNFHFLSSAERMDIVSSSANDSVSGIGLQAVNIFGLDSDFKEINETVILNGATAVKTVKSYLRINMLIGVQCGSHETNAGDITATAETSSTLQDVIKADKGVSHSGKYTVPVGYTAFPFYYCMDVNRTLGIAGSLADFRIKTRYNLLNPSAPWLEMLDMQIDTNNSCFESMTPPIFIDWYEKTDIKLDAVCDNNNINCRAILCLILLKK